MASSDFGDTDAVRLALSRTAYDLGSVRLAHADLRGYTHVVASRQGLFAVRENGHRLIAHGLFFGITVSGPSIYLFESCDLPRFQTRRGRIVRLIREGDRITGTEILATGLSNGCHQIDLVCGRLCILDTYGQRVIRYALEDGSQDVAEPLPASPRGDWSGGYAHFNSLLEADNRILLVLHNGGAVTGRRSELAILDSDWHLTDRRPLRGEGCHNLALLEDGSLLTCASLTGELVGLDGLRVKVSPMMTRGLSVDADRIAVGASAYSSRWSRHSAAGTVTFLDRSYRILNVLDLPGAPTEIRRLDGKDLTLSEAVKATKLRLPGLAVQTANIP